MAETVTQVAQLKAENTAALNKYAGALGQLVYDKATTHMHIMKGTAGQHIKLANYDDIANHGYSKGEADGKYAVKANVYTKTETYSKNEIDGKISGVYIYKGTKANLSEIQAIPSKQKGDVWNAQDTGMNYAWDGTQWDALGGTVDLSTYATKEELNTKLGKTEKAESAKTADTATKATQDGQGRVFTEIYLEKSVADSKYQPKGEYLTAQSNLDYTKLINVPKIIDYGTLTNI